MSDIEKAIHRVVLMSLDGNALLAGEIAQGLVKDKNFCQAIIDKLEPQVVATAIAKEMARTLTLDGGYSTRNSSVYKSFYRAVEREAAVLVAKRMTNEIETS